VQLLLAVPFLYTSPLNYLLGAFNLGRVFLFQWTVNFRYTDPVRALIDFFPLRASPERIRIKLGPWVPDLEPERQKLATIKCHVIKCLFVLCGELFF
jgi:hypothetical protein